MLRKILVLKTNSKQAIKAFQSFSNIAARNFDETQFIRKFLDVSQKKQQYSKQEIDQLISTMKENIRNITRPNSIAVILHKIQNFRGNVDENLQNLILEQSVKVYKSNYDFSDNGDLIRAAVLVACLQKLHNKFFFDEMSQIILVNIEKFSFVNLMTIIESYSYNKLLFKHFEFKNIEKALNSLNQKVNGNLLDHIPKYNNLMYYLAKNNKYEIDKSSSDQLNKLIESLIKNVYNIILQTIINSSKAKSIDVFSLTDSFLSLNPFNASYPVFRDQYKLLGKQYQSFINEYLPDPQKMILVKYNIPQVISFLKRYHSNPPLDINPRLCEFINKIFWANYSSEGFKSLEVYCYFLLFLLKSKKLEIDSSKSLNIFDMIIEEKNLVVLAKVLEIYLISSKTNQNLLTKHDFQALEKVIFDTIDKIPKEYIISPAIVQIFQFMVALDSGDTEKWKKMFAIFSNINNLKKLDYLELIIRLVPAGGVKTKNVYKSFSNASLSLLRHDIKKTGLDPDLGKLINQFWRSLETLIIERIDQIHFDKIPIILFYFTYANLAEFNFKSIYNKYQKKVLENLEQFNFNEISDIAYSYSRVQIQADELFQAVGSKLLKMNLKGNNLLKVSNIYWAFANAKLYYDELSKVLEEIMFENISKIDLESFSEFVQALAINSQRLTKEQKIILSQTAYKFLINDKNKETNVQLILGILNGFNILENFEDIKFWDLSLDLLESKTENFNQSPVMTYYLYLLYVHLSITGNGTINHSRLYPIIQQNYNKIIDYIKFNKKKSKSPFEEEVKRIIDQNQSWFTKEEILDKENTAPILAYKNNLHQFYLLKKFLDYDPKNKNDNLLGPKDMLIPYTIDILIGKYAIEVNGPNHYLVDNTGNLRENGFNKLKRRLLEKCGFQYIEIPYSTYEQAADKTKFIFERIKKIS